MDGNVVVREINVGGCTGVSQIQRTPTPFKKALAELRRQAVANGQDDERLVDDITEIISKDRSSKMGGGSSSMADSVYDTDMSTLSHRDEAETSKENAAPHGRKVRKALGNVWDLSELPYLVETPVSYVLLH